MQKSHTIRTTQRIILTICGKIDTLYLIMSQLTDEIVIDSHPMSIDLQSINPAAIKSPGELNKRERNQLVYEALRSQGFNPYQISQILQVNTHTAYRRESKVGKGLLAPLVTSAKKAVKETLKGRAIGDATPPKTSDVIAAAKLVLDREDPVINKIESKNMSVSVEITAEEKTRIKQSLGLIPQDVVLPDSTTKQLEHNNE